MIPPDEFASKVLTKMAHGPRYPVPGWPGSGSILAAAIEARDAEWKQLAADHLQIKMQDVLAGPELAALRVERDRLRGELSNIRLRAEHGRDDTDEHLAVSRRLFRAIGEVCDAALAVPVVPEKKEDLGLAHAPAGAPPTPQSSLDRCHAALDRLQAAGRALINSNAVETWQAFIAELNNPESAR